MIQDKYIVKYKNTFSIASVSPLHTLKLFSDGADRVYSHLFQGFASTLNSTAVEQLRNHPDVRTFLSHVKNLMCPNLSNRSSTSSETRPSASMRL